jgi:hypothetical protein
MCARFNGGVCDRGRTLGPRGDPTNNRHVEADAVIVMTYSIFDAGNLVASA